MKVTLIGPNIRERTEKGEDEINVHLPVQSYPFLGLAYLASVLEKVNFDVNIIDASALNLTEEQVVREVRKVGAEVVGFYVTSFSLPFVYNSISKIRQSLNSVIVVGGPHITHYPQSLLTLGADYGIVGEGEESFPKLLESISKGKVDNKVNGLVYQKDGNVTVNPPKKIANLDEIPFPARHLLPNEKYFSPLWGRGKKITTMITSRGCMYDCVFCALPTKRSYRQRSSDNIIGEIEQIYDEGFRYIQVEDDFFTLSRGMVTKICESIIEKKLNLEWGCETRADFVDDDLLRLMKKAGCTNIHFGVESGCERVRNDIIGKRLSNETIQKAFQISKKAGLETVGYFMFGHPTETLDEMMQTVRFAKRVNSDYADFHIAVPIPGSRLFEIARKERKVPEDVWDRVMKGESIPFYVPDGVQLGDMRRLQKDAYSYFYFRLSKILREVSKVRSFEDFVIRARTSITILKEKVL